jgi:nitroreductase
MTVVLATLRSERFRRDGRSGDEILCAVRDARFKEADRMDYSRLSMPLGEAIFTQRSIRRFRADPIPLTDIRLVLEAAVRAPNGGNQQVARFLVVNDRATIKEFGAIYHEAWWAKRRDEGFSRPEDLPARFHSAAGLADAMADVPCIVFALAMHNGPANSVLPAVQNLMLAARAIGIGSVPTTLHPSVMTRFHAMFGIPDDVGFHFCVPLGYPQGNFGPNDRLPTSATSFLDRWDSPVPWE